MKDPAQIAEGVGWGSAGTALLVLATRVPWDKLPWGRILAFLRWAVRKVEKRMGKS